MNVDRMLDQISFREFMEWRAYADIEPWDETRQDVRTAQIVCALLNQNRRKGQKAITLQDCMLQFGTPAEEHKAKPEDARAAVLRTMHVLMAIHNKPEKKKRKR